MESNTAPLLEMRGIKKDFFGNQVLTDINFTLKAGYLEGKAIGEDEVKKLAAMPSKETLIAQVLYSFNYPIMQLAMSCDAIVKKAEGNEEMKVAELVAPKEAAAEEAAE